MFLQSFPEFFSEDAFINFLGRLFQKRLPCNKSEFIPWRVECAGVRCNVYPFFESYGKKLS